MPDSQSPPASGKGERAPDSNRVLQKNSASRASRYSVSPLLVRNLAIVLVIVALGFGFGRPLAAGYYFGGCDDAEGTQQYLIHVFGIAMCRDIPLKSQAESRTLREAEAIPPTGEAEQEEEAAPPPTATPTPPAAGERKAS
jgi:hypothetical protein